LVIKGINDDEGDHGHQYSLHDPSNDLNNGLFMPKETIGLSIDRARKAAVSQKQLGSLGTLSETSNYKN